MPELYLRFQHVFVGCKDQEERIHLLFVISPHPRCRIILVLVAENPLAMLGCDALLKGTGNCTDDLLAEAEPQQAGGSKGQIGCKLCVAFYRYRDFGEMLRKPASSSGGICDPQQQVSRARKVAVR